jgi:serine/threonine-protein kinase
VARTVKMSSPGALPVTTPQGTVPTAALEAARRKQAQPSMLVLAGIAAGCLIAGILITMVALRIFG